MPAIFYILYEDSTGKNTWEMVFDEDAMLARRAELTKLVNEPHDICVFRSSDEVVIQGGKVVDDDE